MRSRSATEVPPNFITMRDKRAALQAKGALLATPPGRDKVDVVRDGA
jgi:hypothetical protein